MHLWTSFRLFFSLSVAPLVLCFALLWFALFLFGILPIHSVPWFLFFLLLNNQTILFVKWKRRANRTKPLSCNYLVAFLFYIRSSIRSGCCFFLVLVVLLLLLLFLCCSLQSLEAIMRVYRACVHCKRPYRKRLFIICLCGFFPTPFSLYLSSVSSPFFIFRVNAHTFTHKYIQFWNALCYMGFHFVLMLLYCLLIPSPLLFSLILACCDDCVPLECI